MKIFKIALVSDAAAMHFAAEELKRYLTLISPAAEVALIRADAYAPAPDTIWLLDSHPELTRVEDAALDDAIYIRVNAGGGVIAGANPRAVLIAVYRFLRELGCKWVRPGKYGEILPESLPDNPDIRVSEVPSYRHRGVCIEGAVSYSHVADMIEWLPKVGMNSYFTQFFVPYAFFDRWYAHHGNPGLEPHQLTRAEVEGMTRRHERELKMRGLMYHAVGHGWTCEPFGVEGLGWDTSVFGIPEIETETLRFFALVDGKRELSNGIPLNTQLCYSQAEVRERVVTAIRDHCAAHPEIDYVHFWLADGVNNHCECPDCADTLPSDYYVMMLNELDRLLTESNVNTKVVFLIYVDLLWPPQREKLNNSGRFVMMFAPITRTYSAAYTVDMTQCPDELPPFVRNKLDMPRSVEDNVAFLNKWREMFDGDSFIFDYHFMWDHFRDPGYTDLARLLRDDMSGLKNIGLNGMISCQAFRVFFPTGLPMNIMARALWDKTTRYEEFAPEFYADAYGEHWRDVAAYMERLTRGFDPVYMRHEKPQEDAVRAAAFRDIRPLIADFEAGIDGKLTGNRSQDIAWQQLKLHGEYCVLLSRVMETKASGGDVTEGWEELAKWVRRNEAAIAEVFDLYEFFFTCEKMANDT